MYLVEVKRTARRASADAGAWVRDHGRRRAFDSKADAREWAADCSGERTVWVQDTRSRDGSPADGYLVARRHPPVEYGDTPGEQAALDAV